MKVYVDKLPKKCEDCYFYKNNSCLFAEPYCLLDKKSITFDNLADYTKQVRKEVCEEFKEIVRQKYPICYMNFGEQLFNSSDMAISLKKVTEILDQIQGETK